MEAGGDKVGFVNVQVKGMSKASEKRRVTFRVTEEEYELIKYRAMSREMSVDEFIRYALDKVIAVEMGEYDVPNLLIQRHNQLIDMMASQGKNLENLEKLIVDSFSQLLGLTRGDNYLLEEENGELY